MGHFCGVLKQSQLHVDRGEQGERGEGEAIQQSGRLSRTHQKGEEQGSCREEVPDIVVIKESQQDARPVLFPGLCWSLLGGQAEGQDLISTHTGPLLATLDPTGITLSLPSKQDPGKGAVLARPVARAGHEHNVMLKMDLGPQPTYPRGTLWSPHLRSCIAQAAQPPPDHLGASPSFPWRWM